MSLSTKFCIIIFLLNVQLSTAERIEPDEDGNLRLEEGVYNVLSIPSTIKDLLILSAVELQWDTSLPLNLTDLRKLDCVEAKLNPKSISFSRNLIQLEIMTTELVNGSLVDLLSSATHLEYLRVDGIGQMDICSLKCTSTLLELQIIQSELSCSTRSTVFEKLEYLALGEGTLEDKKLFNNFHKMFPNINRVETGVKFILNPTALLSILKTNVTSVSFSFDFQPQVRTYEFGVALKFMIDAGLYIEADDTSQDRVRFVGFLRESPQDGDGWSVGEEYSRFFEGEVDDIKSEAPKRVIYIYFSILYMLIGVGLLGNILSGCVLLRKEMRNSAGLNLLALTFFDTFIILTYLFSTFSNVVIFQNVFFKSGRKQEAYTVEDYVWMAEQDSVQAFLVYPLNKTAYTGAVYTTVLISLERFIAVCMPLKAMHLLSLRNTMKGIFGIIVFSVLLNSPRWIESYEWNNFSNTSLSWNEYYRPTFMRTEIYRVVYHGWVWSCVMYVLPFALLGFFNYQVLKHIKISRQFRHAIASRTDGDTELMSTTKMLTIVVALFVVCNSVHIGIVFYFLLAFEGAQLSTIEAVSCFPVIVNSSVNFVIYIIFGKKLRTVFLKMIPEWMRCGRPTSQPQNLELTVMTSN